MNILRITVNYATRLFTITISYFEDYLHKMEINQTARIINVVLFIIKCHLLLENLPVKIHQIIMQEDSCPSYETTHR